MMISYLKICTFLIFIAEYILYNLYSMISLFIIIVRLGTSTQYLYDLYDCIIAPIFIHQIDFFYRLLVPYEVIIHSDK